MSNFRFAKNMFFAFALCAVTAIISPAQTLTTLVSFDGADGNSPQSMIQATDGNFYGVTYSGGAYNNGGTIFKVTPGGALTTLYNFCSQSNCIDGENPAGQLLQAKDGNLYGTTFLGGGNCVIENGAMTGCGTVFKITTGGQFTSLYSFCSIVVEGLCADGISPYAGLIQGIDGNLYGTATYGGDNAADNCFDCNGAGTVFRITTAGELTTIFQFCNSINSTGYCLDGDTPYGGLLQTADGTFYGTLYDGGTGTDNSGGVVYKLTASGQFTVLHSFGSSRNWSDGAYPFDSLIQRKDGNLYGTTRNGGYGGAGGYGTVFKITPSGTLTTLHRFRGKDGNGPYAALIEGTDGNLYGTNSSGGPFSDTGNASGTAFKITTSGDESTVYAFCSLAACVDGYMPIGSLVQGKDGDFYGTTSGGGTSFEGTVFRISQKK
jgi:uncharacterized repeat protein (TIGR03803 family)